MSPELAEAHAEELVEVPAEELVEAAAEDGVEHSEQCSHASRHTIVLPRPQSRHCHRPLLGVVLVYL